MPVVRRCLVLAALLAGGLVPLTGCRPDAPDPFVGVWKKEPHRLDIGVRGIGTGRVFHLTRDGTFTWKRVSGERIVIEFGQNSTTRSQMEARLSPDGTLVVSSGRNTVALVRVEGEEAEEPTTPPPAE